MFIKSYIRSLEGGIKTVIAPEEICSNFTLGNEEIDIFMNYGETDLNKTEKTTHQVEKDKRVVFNPEKEGFEVIDPRILLVNK